MKKEQTPDMVNHPSHYCQDGAMECIDEMVAVFGKTAVQHFCLLNVWKYRKRAVFKNGEEDMKKAEFEFIVCSIVDEMVGFLMEDFNMSILEAFNKIYTSKIYEKLQDKETRLYLRSAAYTYEHLKKEL